MRYWQIYLIIIGLILIYISTIVVILDWLVVNGFLILFIGLLGIVWKYVKRPPRADKYNFKKQHLIITVQNVTVLIRNLLMDMKQIVNILI